MEGIFTFLKTTGQYLWDFITFLLSMPTLLTTWISKFPMFMQVGLGIVLTLVTIIIAIKLFNIFKEMIKIW